MMEYKLLLIRNEKVEEQQVLHAFIQQAINP